MGTLEYREPQEYSRNIKGIYRPGSLHSWPIPMIFLGSLGFILGILGVPSLGGDPSIPR